MAEVVDIIHKLTFETNPDVLQAVNKEFGTQLQQLQQLKQREQEYNALLSKTSESDIRNRKAIELLLQRNRQQYDAIAVSVGKQFAANEKLNTSLVKTGRNLSSLSMAGSQLLREAPAFTFSLQTGVLALSNNIPILLDQLKQARAQGSTTTEIFKALGSSVFGLTGIITIAVSAFTIFADKIFASGKAAKDANEDYNKYLETIRNTNLSAVRSIDEQVSKTRLLIATINDQRLSVEKRNDAYLELQALRPDLLAGLSREQFLQQNLQKTIESQIAATQKQNALQKDANEIAQEQKRLLEERNVAESRLSATLEARDRKLRQFEGKPIPEGAQGGLAALDDLIKRRQQQVANITAQIDTKQAEINRINGQINVLNAQTGSSGETRRQQIEEEKRLGEEYNRQAEELARIRDRIREIAREVNSLSSADFEKFGKSLEDELKQRATAVEKFFDTIAPGLIQGALENIGAVETLSDSDAIQLEVQLRTNERDKKIKAEQDKKDKERKQKEKELIDENLNYAFNATVSTLQSIYEMQLYYLDKEIAARQDRVARAVELAEKGNTEILQSEREKLIAAQNERDKIGQRQLQLNALLQASSAAIAATQAIQTVTNAGATGDPYSAPVRIAAAVAALAAGFAFVTSLTQAFKSNSFKDGVIGIDGAGTETSDSIPARLSKGESVMTAKETKKYKEYLLAMRDGSFDKMLKTHEPVYVGGGNNYKPLERKLDRVIDAIESNKVVARQTMDKNGISQAIETYKKYERQRFI